MGHSRARALALMVIAVMVAGLLAACGSSSSTSSTPSAAASPAGGGAGAPGAAGTPATRAKLAACLKQHGVTLPARRPGHRNGAGGGFFGGGGGTPGGRGGGHGFQPHPKLRAAFQACGGVGGFKRPGAARLSHASIEKFVTCVRQHGYDLPDPNFSGKGAVFPAKIESKPTFQAASRACRSQLITPGGPAPGGAPPSGA